MKKLYCVEGEIERADIYFKEFVQAHSEAQAKKLTWLRQKEKYPDIKVFLINIVVNEIPSRLQPPKPIILIQPALF